jgi:transposase
VARLPRHPVDVKLKVVLSVLVGESTQAEAARRYGVSETSIGKWKEHFVSRGPPWSCARRSGWQAERPGGQACGGD